ncbi:MAG: SAM-dependent methyltransferase [Betaproteobacteria bacterium]
MTQPPESPRPGAPSLPSGLPSPDAAALIHGARVAARIVEDIRRAGGWIPFSAFMRLALYAPGLGYYVAGARKFGADGDFYTAPELSPLFGQALANQVAEVLRESGGGVLELGAGTGQLAAELLIQLESMSTLPNAYAILETSPDLRERQRETLAARVPHLATHVQWLDALPAAWTGVIVGNEVLDALPAELLYRQDDVPLRRGVALDAAGGFIWKDRPLREGVYRAAISALFPEGDYLSEINPEAEALTATLARLLQRGLLLWIDYGFPAREYYHPQRTAGTLMCHYRQYSHADPLMLAGLQDITAHVDFSAIARAGEEAGLDLAGYTGQATFLLNCGITDLLQQAGEPGTETFLRESNAVQRLLSPAEMGELFKVIGFTRGIARPLRGFARGDRAGRL